MVGLEPLECSQRSRCESWGAAKEAQMPTVRTASGALVAVPGRRSRMLRNGWQRLGMQALLGS